VSFTADHGIQAARRAVPPNHMPTRDRGRRAPRLPRQRPNSGLRVQHAVRKTGRTGNTRSVSLVRYAIFARIDRGGARVAFEALVRGADQRKSFHGRMKNGARRARLHVHAGARRARKRRDDHMAALVPPSNRV